MRRSTLLRLPGLLLMFSGLAVGFGRDASGEQRRGMHVPIDQGLEAFTKPTGTWRLVGSVTLSESNPKHLKAAPGKGVLLNTESKPTSDLLTVREFGDVKAHIEFLVPESSNSGVYFMGRYEVQILDSWGKKKPADSDCGGIYHRWDESRGKGNEGFDGHAPRLNASLRPGKWQTFDVIFHAPRFDRNRKKVANAKFVQVVHNGLIVHEDVELTGPTRASRFGDEASTGPLMLQGDHGPVAYRNLRIEALEN